MANAFLVSLASLLLAAHAATQADLRGTSESDTQKILKQWAPAATQADLRSMSESDTQELLKQWGLYEEFGDTFQQRGFNGLSLSLMEDSHYSDSTFPHATPIHFKMLLHKVAVMDTASRTAPRRLAETAPDTKEYIGIRVKTNKALLALGENLDVRLIRSGASELSVAADKTKFFGSVSVNGKPLGGTGSDLDAATKRITALEAQVKTFLKGSPALAFDPMSAIGQATVAAICTGAQYGGTGQTTAVRKDCGSSVKKTCKEVCAGLNMQCLESIHLYGDDGADKTHIKGIRTHIYGSCDNAGCGPNYCCCTTNPVDNDNDFDAHNVLGQTLVNAVCTAAQLSTGGTGQTAAVRRECTGTMTCDTICKGISQKCIESVHMYGNDAATEVHKKGMFTHLYGSCTATGCGPNYCCCTTTPGISAAKRITALEAQVKVLNGGSALAFDPVSAIGQATVAAICTAAQYGGTGQTTAVRKDCGSSVKKTCKEICAGLNMQCLESIHLYGDDGADKTHIKGIRTHIYGSCNNAGCGPNYCCCTTNPVDDNDFDAHNVLGQTLVNAVCTAAQLSSGGTGQTAAVRRQCSGTMTCDTICKGISQKCIESVHMYGNDAATEVHKKGMFTHLYGSCTATGCGPNYCCCTTTPGNMKNALAVVGISPSGGLDQGGLIAQSLVQAACMGAYNIGSGQVAAFKRTCAGGQPTCAQLCVKVGHGKCFQSYHMYAGVAHDADFEKGFFNHLYGGCDSGGCGPNYCCCVK